MSNFYLNIRQYGNDMLVRSFEDGKRQMYKSRYEPYLFVKGKDSNEYRTVHDESVKKLQFNSIKDAKNFTKKYQEMDGFEYYGMTNFVYPFINDKFPGEIKYDRDKINVVSLDIETESDDGFPDIETGNKAITAIAISDGTKIVFLSVKKYKKHQDNIEVIKARDERELVINFIEIWRDMDPDIITGWNVEFFDIPYLINRIRRISGNSVADFLSPWNIIKEKRQKNQYGDEQLTYDIYGVSVMDYMLVYKKWSFVTRESYRLEHIAQVELGMGKISYEGTLHELYERDFQLYATYNIRDTEIINQLDEKLKLMDLALAIAYDAKLNYIDSFTSVRMWDVISHNYLMDRKIVIPQYKYDGKPFDFMGGYVKDVYVGEHPWVCSFDLNSLYPSLIQQYNISPESFVSLDLQKGKGVESALNGSYNECIGFLRENNVTMTPNGCLWSKNKQGFLPALMEKMYSSRKAFKGKMIEKKNELEKIDHELHMIEEELEKYKNE